MGISIGDSVTASTGGSSHTNTYGSLGTSDIRIEKQDSNYFISTRGFIWTSQSARNAANITHITTQALSLTINGSQLSSNIYSLLYAVWKSKYSSVSDVL